MKKYLFLLIIALIACSPILNKTGVITLIFAGEIPSEALNVASFDIRISKVTVPQTPKQILTAPDSLTIMN